MRYQLKQIGVPLRRYHRERRSALSNDYLNEPDYTIGQVNELMSSDEAILSEESNKWIITWKEI